MGYSRIALAVMVGLVVELTTPSLVVAETRREVRAGKVAPTKRGKVKPAKKRPRKARTAREAALAKENARLKAEVAALREQAEASEATPTPTDTVAVTTTPTAPAVEPVRTPEVPPADYQSTLERLALTFVNPTIKPIDPASDPSITRDLVTTLRDGTPLYRRRTQAARRTAAVKIDGVADEQAWQAAPAAQMDWQVKPAEGDRATGPTAFRVLYDDDAVYVSAAMTDPEPTAIMGLLYRPLGFRRVERSDWIIAVFAPSDDRSIAYAFAINPAGVKVDYRMTRTAPPDETYSAIWDAAIDRTSSGWQAEFRIPLSQMRVSDGERPWGLQLFRNWSRSQERDCWSPCPQTFKQELAAMGDMVIDDKLDRGLSVELLPYVLGGSRYEQADPTNALSQTLEPEYGIGADFKAQLGGSLKLTASVNPDFGQIEADPSEVNLTDRETFFSERRPLFSEDADLYQFAIGRGNENLFYTRRIGARPHFSQASSAQYIDESDATTIYGAAKLSGTLPGDIKLGLLSALAAEERSRAQLMTGEVQETVVEPMTSYNVVQLGRTFRGGASELRLAGTGVHRFLDGTGIDRLNENAYAGAVQYVHRFADNSWSATALYGGSYLQGDPAALAVTQRASQRYMQRPDAEHVDFIPTRTFLSGFMFGGQVAKIAGSWRGGFALDARSPGFETNDVGFLLDSDLIAPSASVIYEVLSKTGPTKQFGATLTGTSVLDFGPELLRNIGQLDAETRLRNDWLVGGSLIYTRELLDTKLLRGGPAVAGVDSGEARLYVETDPKRRVSLRLDAAALGKPASESWRALAGLNLTWDVLPNLELTLGPSYIVNHERTQYVGAADDAMGKTHYLLGELEQQTVLARMRLNLTITPRMSLQAYGEPFLSAGKYSRFKEATAVRAAAYGDRFTELDPARVVDAMGTLQIDSDGDGAPDLSVRRPDFQLGTLLTNLVFRWEYRPGSHLYLIWSQSRDSAERDGVIDRGDLGEVFTSHSAHVVLVKLSFWANL